MTDRSALKKRLKDIVDQAIDGKTSSTLREQLFQIIDEAGDESTEIEKGLEKVRITIKLFIDEKLAERVSQDLRSAVTSAAARK